MFENSACSLKSVGMAIDLLRMTLGIIYCWICTWKWQSSLHICFCSSDDGVDRGIAIFSQHCTPYSNLISFRAIEFIDPALSRPLHVYSLIFHFSSMQPEAQESA